MADDKAALGRYKYQSAFRDTRNRSQEYLVNVLGEDEFHLRAGIFRQIPQVFLILFRNDHPLDPQAPGRQHFFFDATNRQHQTRERYFACH